MGLSTLTDTVTKSQKPACACTGVIPANVSYQIPVLRLQNNWFQVMSDIPQMPLWPHKGTVLNGANTSMWPFMQDAAASLKEQCYSSREHGKVNAWHYDELTLCL